MKEWNEFLLSIENELGKKPVDDWLRPLKVVRFDAGNLYLDPPSPLHVSWFEEYVKPKASLRLKSANHRPIKIHWIKETAAINKTPSITKIFQNDLLDPSFTLDHFIQCPKNKVAYCLFENWFKTEKLPYNPLFLYGSQNAGKTHLLTSAAHHFSKSKKVIFIKANTFTEHLVHGIRSNQMDLFRKHYRDADLLIIDQIDQFSGRVSTQEEYFHTFNTLHTQGKEILIASRFAPSKLTGIEPRLISRFEWGLSLEIGRVDLPLLIEKKAAIWNLRLEKSTVDFLIEHFADDPITALQTLSIRSMGSSTITKELAIQLLQDLFKAKSKNTPSFEEIIDFLSKRFSIESSDITGKSQRREHAFPRQVAMYLCRTKLKMPYQTIGKLFGRDHSTVMGSVKQIEDKILKKDPSISGLI